MSPQPYIDGDRADIVRPGEATPATCALCGLTASTFTIRERPAFWRLPQVDAAGKHQAITAVLRCLDVDACRTRVLAVGGEWPLLLPGEGVPALPVDRSATEGETNAPA
jgi:hypothetical protein